MDREFAVVLHRALLMIVRYLEGRFGLGKQQAAAPPADEADPERAWSGYHDN